MSETPKTKPSAPDTAHSKEHEASHADDIQEQVRVYILVFAALAVLTVVTVAVGYLHLPIVPALIIGLLIATVKGALVAGYFMHLISERKVVYIILGFTAVFFLAMLILTTSSFYDQIG